MKTNDLYSKLINSLQGRRDVWIEKHKVHYKKGKYDVLKIKSRNIGKKDKVVLITAGIHGDEIAGPLTLFKYINEIITRAHTQGLKIIIYPLTNPSGFDKTRYNIDNYKGTYGNNDFIRYTLKDGRIVDDLGSSTDFVSFDLPKVTDKILPQETRLLHSLIKKDIKNNIIASIDLHQDYLTPTKESGAYHYSFGNLKLYKDIIKQIEKIVPIYKNKPVGAGFSVKISKDGKIAKGISNDLVVSDKQGFIVRHDGSLSDYMFRLGVKYCVTTETFSATPLDVACKVNLIWIKGIIDLAAKD